MYIHIYICTYVHRSLAEGQWKFTYSGVKVLPSCQNKMMKMLLLLLLFLLWWWCCYCWWCWEWCGFCLGMAWHSPFTWYSVCRSILATCPTLAQFLPLPNVPTELESRCPWQEGRRWRRQCKQRRRRRRRWRRQLRRLTLNRFIWTPLMGQWQFPFFLFILYLFFHILFLPMST